MSQIQGSAVRRRGLWIVPAVLVVAVIVLGHVLWWSRPSAFYAQGESRIGGSLKVGVTLNVDMAAGPKGDDVVAHGATPVVTENTADADIELVVCRWRHETHMGADNGSLDRWCSSLAPVDGEHLSLRATPAEGIIARITPRRAGMVRLHGIDLDYSRDRRHLWQTGTQRIGPEVAVSAK